MGMAIGYRADIFNRFDMPDCPSNDIIRPRGVTARALITVFRAAENGPEELSSAANQFVPSGSG